MAAQEVSSASPPQIEGDRPIVSLTISEEPQEPAENGDDNSTETMTMEERKAKLARLRARMVSFSLAALSITFIVPSLALVHETKQAVTHRGVCKGENHS